MFVVARPHFASSSLRTFTLSLLTLSPLSPLERTLGPLTRVAIRQVKTGQVRNIMAQRMVLKGRGNVPLGPNMSPEMRTRMEKIAEVGISGRRLIVACDGTWVNSDMDPSATIPSNVTRLCRALRPPPTTPESVKTSAPTKEPQQKTKKTQIVYYHRGIGTDGGLESKYLGGGTGNELSEHARECYDFICSNWRDGDEIFLFGFSRGAYTVRAISALISDVGLLTAKGMDYFYEVYEDWKNQNVTEMQPPSGRVETGVFAGMATRPKMPSEEYRQALLDRKCVTIHIPVIATGVWDTVGALGVPPILGHQWTKTKLLQYSFVNTKVSQCIVHAFQALALDEHRAAFSPAIWELSDKPNNLTTLRQCWFPGVHANIGGGGGYEDQGMANVTLAWMVSQLNSVTSPNGTQGLLDFDEEYLRWVFKKNIEHVRSVDPKVGFRGWGLGKIIDSMTWYYELVGEKKRQWTPTGSLKSWLDSGNWKDWLVPGDAPRTPGAYDEIDASGGHLGAKTGKKLVGTGEKVHRSTRVRVAGGGKGAETDGVEPDSYMPEAMKGWKIIGTGDRKDPLAKGFTWQSADGKVILEEDELGGLEKELLALSVVAVAQGNSKLRV